MFCYSEGCFQSRATSSTSQAPQDHLLQRALRIILSSSSVRSWDASARYVSFLCFSITFTFLDGYWCVSSKLEALSKKFRKFTHILSLKRIQLNNHRTFKNSQYCWGTIWPRIQIGALHGYRILCEVCSLPYNFFHLLWCIATSNGIVSIQIQLTWFGIPCRFEKAACHTPVQCSMQILDTKYPHKYHHSNIDNFKIARVFISVADSGTPIHLIPLVWTSIYESCPPQYCNKIG